MRTIAHNRTAYGPILKQALYVKDNDNRYWLTIPKCGLSTVREFISGQSGEDYLSPHAPSVDTVYDHIAAGGKCIMTIRHPVERIISAYRWANWHYQYTGSPQEVSIRPFDDWMDEVESVPDEERDIHVRSQSWYLTTETNRTIVPTDYLVTERLSEDLAKHTFYPIQSGNVRVTNASTGPIVVPDATITGRILQLYHDDWLLYQRENPA